MSNLLCVLSKFIFIMSCHGNHYILYSRIEFFLKTFFFSSNLVGPMNTLAPMRNCPVGAKKAKLAARPVNILPILKVGGVIPSGK